MKKKLLSTLLVLSMTASLFTGCGCSRTPKVSQTNTTMTMEIGTTFVFNIGDYFSYDDNSAIKEGSYTVDASAVNTQKPGTYDVKVVFGEKDKAKEYTVTVSVEDTTAPELTLKESDHVLYVLINDLKEDFDASEYVSVKDATNTTTKVSYRKLGNMTVLSDEALNKYAGMKADEDVNDEKDGYYEMTVTVTDEGNNSASVSLLAVCDVTAPVLLFNGKEVKDGDTISAKDPENVQFTAKDNCAGDISSEDVVYAYNKDTKTATVHVYDRVSNKTEITVKVTAPTQTADKGNSSGGSSGSSSGGSSSGSSSGGVQTSETPVSNDPVLNKYPNFKVDHIASDGTIYYEGRLVLNNGYTLPIDYNQEQIEYWKDCGEHINQVHVDKDDHWVIWAVDDNDEWTNDNMTYWIYRYWFDGDMAINRIATQYVQSLYGPEYKATMVRSGSSSNPVWITATGKLVTGRYGRGIKVYCPDGVARELDTDNAIKYIDSEGNIIVWKTPGEN